MGVFGWIFLGICIFQLFIFGAMVKTYSCKVKDGYLGLMLVMSCGQGYAPVILEAGKNYFVRLKNSRIIMWPTADRKVTLELKCEFGKVRYQINLSFADINLFAVYLDSKKEQYNDFLFWLVGQLENVAFSAIDKADIKEKNDMEIGYVVSGAIVDFLKKKEFGIKLIQTPSVYFVD